MNRRLAVSRAALAVVVASSISCSSTPPPTYDSPPTLANREEITEALRAVGSGLDANVVLLVNVDQNGRALRVRIGQSSGDEGLDAAAVWVGERMRFEPAMHDGKPVAALVKVPVTFDVVTAPVRPPRLRNAEEIAVTMVGDFANLEGFARLRIRVDPEGNINLVKDRQTSGRDVLRAAHDLVRDLEFWPAFKSFRPVETWVNVIFEFAGSSSQVRIESSDG